MTATAQSAASRAQPLAASLAAIAISASGSASAAQARPSSSLQACGAAGSRRRCGRCEPKRSARVCVQAGKRSASARSSACGLTGVSALPTDSTSLAAVVCLRISSAACVTFRASGSAVARGDGCSEAMRVAMDAARQCAWRWMQHGNARGSIGAPKRRRPPAVRRLGHLWTRPSLRRGTNAVACCVPRCSVTRRLMSPCS